ncbi:MAG: SusC/RagA family TonB-linked outer membrane protein [Bacteroidota bacterium]
MKKLSLVLMLVLFAMGTALAQRTISGTVTDESGETLIGASILVKGTPTGTVTEVDGTYKLALPDGASVLVISYTGFESQELEIGVSDVIDVVMKEGAAELAEVVVTGLGIRKEKKALGYAVTSISQKDLELRPEADVARVLRGKVPGVDITQTSGLAGSGTNVIIRGYSSITGTNQPLFVVDGVPFNSDTNNDVGFDEGGASASSRFLDLDPNNIAEVNVLKGLSATVLYGEAGRNGVVLITTKNGAAGDLKEKFSVTVDQGIYVNQIASLPDDQDAYGNGWQNFASGAFSNWGAPFDQPNSNGLTDGTIAHPYSGRPGFDQFDGARYDYRPYDNLQNFFETGVISTTSINVGSQVSENTNLNFSYGYRTEDSFVPLSTFDKHNFGLGIATKLANGFRINSTFNYVSSERIAPPTGVSFSSNPTGASLFSNVFYTPRSVSLFDLPFESPIDGSTEYYRGGNDIQHPLWTLNNTSVSEDIARFFGTINVSYDLTSWLTANYRFGIDSYTQLQRYAVNKGGSNQIDNGQLQTTERQNTISDHTFNLAYNVQLNDDFSLDGVVGLNLRRDTRDFTDAFSQQQFVFGLQVHDNFVEHTNESSIREENLIGAFGTVSLGFRNFLYFNVQARNDWTSTLESANRSVFYPSASLSFIATEAIPALQESSVVNYLKLRVGYGTSAGYPNPYQTRNILGVATRSFIDSDNTVININTVDDQIGNPELKPEIHREVEVGIEGRFFNNRFGLDLSLYNKKSTDLIISLPLYRATGAEETTVNAAEITNDGIELGMDVTPIRTGDFSLTINANYTLNRNIVDKLAEGLEQVPIAGFTNIGNFAIPGQPYGVILGDSRLTYNDNGDLVTDGGLFRIDNNLGVLGDPNPKYTLNGGLSANYKGFSFNALLTYVEGGVIFSTLPSTLMARGILQETDFDRFVPVVAPGVEEQADGSFVPNTTQITPNNHYWRNGGVFIRDQRTFNGSYIKLREVSLGYTLPTKWLEGTPLGSLSLTLSAQNIWFDALGFPDGANFDPEVLSTGVGNGRGFELMNVPTAKQFGANLRVTF